MVSIIQKRKNEILDNNGLEALFYYSLNHIDCSKFVESSFKGENAKVAFNGFCRINTDQDLVDKIMSKKTIKGIDYTNNIYEFIGINLSCNPKKINELNSKFSKFNIKEKFAVSLFFSEYTGQLEGSLLTDLFSKILYLVLEKESLSDEDNKLINQFESNSNADIIDCILYEQLYNKFSKIKFNSLTATETVIHILDNFQNSIKKITTERRKDKIAFIFDNEYDVQDIVYLLFKGLFYDLQYENPYMKSGGASSIIDLMSEKEKISIEVKMIKQKDPNEKEFIKQLKIDINDYSKWKDLKDLIIFVYDPYNKTIDKHNFKDLEGKKEINGVVFNVYTIVSN